MLRNQWSRSEKRLLCLSALSCGALLGAASIYEANNRVPQVHLSPRVLPVPNAEAWFIQAATAYVPPPRLPVNAGNDIDLAFGATPPGNAILPYTLRYSQIYPLGKKKPFLRANAAALANLRRGLQLPYAYSFPGYPYSNNLWLRYLDLTQVSIVEAHARAQQNDWDGAADSLLDAFHLGCVLPQEAPSSVIYESGRMRLRVRRDFWELSSHLSASKSRDAARKVEIYRSQIPSITQSLTWEKRYFQEVLISLIAQQDLRPIETGFGYACADLKNSACPVPTAQMQQAVKELSPVLQIRLAWLNKPHLMDELTEHMDWEIAQVSKPYPKRVQKCPESIPNDGLNGLVHGSHWGTSLLHAGNSAQDSMLATSLAIHAFRLEKGRNPRALSELVPRYLARVPLDPFSDGQPLCYKNAPKRFVFSESEEPIYVVAPSQLDAPWALDSLDRTYRTVRHFQTVPFTLYSVGHNARDDNGTPYEDLNQREAPKRYMVNYSLPRSLDADVVAGINN